MYEQVYVSQNGRSSLRITSYVEPIHVRGIDIYQHVSVEAETDGRHNYYYYLTPGLETWGVRAEYGVHRVMTARKTPGYVRTVYLQNFGSYVSIFRVNPGDIIMLCGYKCRTHTFIKYLPENEPKFIPASAGEELACLKLDD